MNKRQQQKETTRKKICDTAAELFAVKGFSIPTSDIAKAAGISHGTLFSHFPTREDLIGCVIDDFFDKLNQKTHEISQDHTALSDFLYEHLAYLQEQENFYCSLIRQMALLPEATGNKLFAHQSTLAFHFGELVLPAQKSGRIKPLPLHMLFNMWIALVHYYIQNRERFTTSDSVLLQYQEELVTTYLKMIEQ